MRLFLKKQSFGFYLSVRLFDKLETIALDKKNIIGILENEIEANLIYKGKFNFKITKITERVIFVEIETKNSNSISEIKNYFEKESDLFPPWIAFPDMFQGVPRWNQGYEEDYCWNYWIPMFKSLTRDKQEDYFYKFNCPTDWKEWLQENSQYL